MNLANKRVTVTGGSGFLGSHLVARLAERGAWVFVARRAHYDLIEASGARRLYKDTQPDVMIHLAARVGGIGANRHNPGLFFYENICMGVNLIEEARRYGKLEKLVLVGTTCSYPKFAPVPFRENDLWNGYPEGTNAPYGVAKKALLVMAQGYRAQYGLNSIYLISANLFGPGDHFDLEASHVIPALIRRFLEARDRGRNEVVLWGDGSPTREFLYVEDAAQAVLLATEGYEKGDPVNLGTGSEISIAQLAELVARLVDYRGQIVWDTAQPNGQPRRRLDVSRAASEFGFRARISLEEGLRRTIAWYQALVSSPK